MRNQQLAALLGALCLGTAAAAPPAAAQLSVPLQEGDIIVLDILDDEIVKVDPVSGQRQTIASGVLSPRGAAASPEGLLYVADTFFDQLLRIDPLTGTAPPPALNYTFGGSPFPEPASVLLDEANGDVLVIEAILGQILRIDPVTLDASVEFQLTGIDFPVGLARDPDGTLVVADRFAFAPGLPGLYRIDIAAGTQETILLSVDFKSLRRVAVQSDGDILVTDRGSGGTGAEVHRIPNGTNMREAFAPGFISAPNGIAVEADDSVLVTDFSPPNGKLYRIAADGNGTPFEFPSSFNGPYAVAVVPPLSPRISEQFLVADAATGVIAVADTGTDARTAIPGGAFTAPVSMAYADPVNPGSSLTSGEIFVIDGPTTIVRRDLASGAESVVSSGGLFTDLTDIAVEADGQIVVSDGGGQVIRVDPALPSGSNQSLLSNQLGAPSSLVVDANGSIIVADASPPVGTSGLFRINPLDGQQAEFTLIAASLDEAQAIARDANGDLLLLDRGDEAGVPASPSEIVRVRGTDQPTLFASLIFYANALNGAVGSANDIAVDGNRDPVVVRPMIEPTRLDGLAGNATVLTVGGGFDGASAVLLRNALPPGPVVDSDSDGIPDGFDNCPDAANTGQEDANADGVGDLCQPFDIDQDGWPDSQDNCFVFPNTGQEDTDGVDADSDGNLDGDGVGDVCDNCPAADNPLQADFNNDGIGDACGDADGDNILDVDDFCPLDISTQNDSDLDGVGNECDNCIDDANPDQSDVDGDGDGDVCQTNDADSDGVSDIDDNCLNVANTPTADRDGDGDIDVADQADTDGDGLGDACQTNDIDSDGISDGPDNCDNVANPVTVDTDGDGDIDLADQLDSNGDGIGDACQPDDTDLDGWPDTGPAIEDNCVDTFNRDQSDVNGDGIGDACQPNDADNDGWPDGEDLCPIDFDPTNGDVNLDGEGDVCQSNDTDGDGWPDLQDSCPLYPDITQSDVNDPDNGIGDVCDNSDGDVFMDAVDNCPLITNQGQEDADGDGLGDVCDPTPLPEPGALWLLLPGLAMLAGFSRSRRARA